MPSKFSFKKAYSGKYAGMTRGKQYNAHVKARALLISTKKFKVPTSGPMGPEIKNFDNNVSITSVVSGTPYVASLTSGIGEGTASNGRIGDRILIKSVELDMNLTAVVGGSVGSSSPPAYIEVFVVWDKSPDGTIANASDIFSTTTTNLTFMNVSNLERFKILRRERYCFSIDQSIGAVYSAHIPLDLATRFADATGVPRTNDIYVCALSPNTVGAGNTTVSIAYVARVKYTDS